MSFSDRKKLAASVSVFSNLVLIILKLLVGFLSGAMSIISEAIHSFSDLLASFLALFSVSKSSEPADDEHQFGHGKYEDFSGLVEGGLILLASFFIIFEATKKIIWKSNIEIDTTLGMCVMLFAVLINLGVSAYLYKVAKSTDSIALYADAEHLRTDVYSSLAVFLGLLAIKLTGIHSLDPIIAIIVAIIIMRSGYEICKKATNNLLDARLPEEEIQVINNSIAAYSVASSLSLKLIKTRKSGMTRQIELTLLVDPNITIKEGHKICDEIEKNISAQLSNTSFIIHLEPTEEE